MPKCPNCDAPVAVDALRCTHCDAEFTEDGWHPVATSPEDAQALKTRYPEKRTEPLTKKRDVSPSSRSIAAVALLTWACSLPLTGLSMYRSEDRDLPGIWILGFGWGAILATNVAWFANATFLVGAIRLRSGRTALFFSLLTLLLALDTVRLSSLQDAGGPIYGYGWGAVAWFVSFCILFAAAATHVFEYAAPPAHGGRALRLLGFCVCIGTLFAAAYLAVLDRQHANASERARLANIAFKRNAVCRTPEPAAPRAIAAFSGILELKIPRDDVYSVYPLNDHERLLTWGVPVVRVNGDDFSFDTSSDPPQLVSVKAAAPPGAVLSVWQVGREGERQAIRATLTDPSDGRVVFDQAWKVELGGSHCPAYTHYPKADDQPRKLLVEALGLAGDAQPAAEPPQAGNNRVDAVVISRAKAEGADVIQGAGTQTGSPSTPDPSLIPGCPPEVAWKPQESQPQTRWRPGLTVYGKTYHLGRTQNVVCNAGALHLYTGSVSTGRYYLTLDKRSLPDFRRLWLGVVILPAEVSLSENSRIRVVSSQQDSSSMTLRLLNSETGETMVVRAPLKAPPVR